MFKSTDAGGTWTSVSSGLPNPPPFNSPPVSALAIDPVTPATLYAGMGWDAGVFKSTDGGATWTSVNAGLPLPSPEGYFVGVNALAIDPRTPTTLYAGTDGDFIAGVGGVFKTTDGGTSWNALNSGLTSYGLIVYALAIDPDRPTTVYAGTEAGVFDIEQVAEVCVGDCGGTHTVAVTDVVTLTNIALGNAESAACPSGLPIGGEVNIAVVIQAVNNALHGCAG